MWKTTKTKSQEHTEWYQSNKHPLISIAQKEKIIMQIKKKPNNADWIISIALS